MPDSTNMKEQARQLIESLPDDTTWEHIVRALLEQQMIEEGDRRFRSRLSLDQRRDS